ncbi:lipoprotein LpqH [Mycobacterium sp. E796]|uniref:lipoprotein LpqH n=1 Tax=Mycobacterium sp. E796 TaxID=1834151 RepID=UPI0012EA0550|nr:lipoprotein LpqH [Mycobacterium sp. E796]
MRNGVLVAVAAAVMAIAGCGSTPAAAPKPRGSLNAGTSLVSIDAAAGSGSSHVACNSPGGSATTIFIGDRSAGVEIAIDTSRGLTAKSIAINNVEGFTGSYHENVQGDARAGLVGQTYTFDGVARGFDVDKPSVVTNRTFSIRVAC